MERPREVVYRRLDLAEVDFDGRDAVEHDGLAVAVADRAPERERLRVGGERGPRLDEEVVIEPGLRERPGLAEPVARPPPAFPRRPEFFDGGPKRFRPLFLTQPQALDEIILCGEAQAVFGRGLAQVADRQEVAPRPGRRRRRGDFDEVAAHRLRDEEEALRPLRTVGRVYLDYARARRRDERELEVDVPLLDGDVERLPRAEVDGADVRLTGPHAPLERRPREERRGRASRGRAARRPRLRTRRAGGDEG